MKEFKRLTKENVDEVYQINLEIGKSLVNPDWFHPFSKESIERFLGENSTHVVYGCFIDGELAGVSLYDYDKEQCAWLSKACNMPESEKGAELGGSVVLPKFRGENIMFDINEILKEEGKKQGLDYFVATAHPDNIASNKNIQKQGFQLITTGINPNGIIRNIYLLKL